MLSETTWLWKITTRFVIIFLKKYISLIYFQRLNTTHRFKSFLLENSGLCTRKCTSFTFLFYLGAILRMKKPQLDSKTVRLIGQVLSLFGLWIRLLLSLNSKCVLVNWIYYHDLLCNFFSYMFSICCRSCILSWNSLTPLVFVKKITVRLLHHMLLCHSVALESVKLLSLLENSIFVNYPLIIFGLVLPENVYVFISIRFILSL